MTYTSSFSKTVAPGVRTGYFLLPERHAGAFEDRAISTYITPPFLPQAIVSEFVERGKFEPNLQRVCGELRARRDAMLQALEDASPAGATWSKPAGGYFVWLEVDGADTAELARRSEAAGVAFIAGNAFFPAGSGGGGSAGRHGSGGRALRCR